LANPAAEDLIRQVLVESTGPALDRAVFSAAAATADRPAGLLNGIAAVPSTGTIEDDLVRLATIIAPVSGNSQIAVVASPAVAVSLNLKLPRQPAFPILTSSGLANSTMIAIALPALVSATEGAPVIDAATQAAIHMDTVPATNISGVGPLRSVWQSDT